MRICGYSYMAVYLDRQISAFHGTNPELRSAMLGDPRSTVASAFHDGHADNDQDAGNADADRPVVARSEKARGGAPRPQSLQDEILAAH